MNSIKTPQTIFSNWMRGFLLISAAYNILWGIFIGYFPETFFQWVTESEASAPGVIAWQGKFVLFMAGVYLACAIHPGRFWYLLFFAAFTKIAGGIWFYFSILEQQVGDKATFHLLMNDGIWVPFLVLIGLRAHAYSKFKRSTESKA